MSVSDIITTRLTAQLDENKYSIVPQYLSSNIQGLSVTDETLPDITIKPVDKENEKVTIFRIMGSKPDDDLPFASVPILRNIKESNKSLDPNIVLVSISNIPGEVKSRLLEDEGFYVTQWSNGADFIDFLCGKNIIHKENIKKMVLIPEGEFLYGSSKNDPMADFGAEIPQELLHLPTFYIDIFPVTNAQYCEFLNKEQADDHLVEKWIALSKDSCRIEKKNGIFKVKNYPDKSSYEAHPVTDVSYYGAEAYAKWADKRLPIEQEWEKAARGEKGFIYPWGDHFDKNRCNSKESGIGDTTEVGSYPDGMSPYGCCDMLGNVWEWTATAWDDKTKVLRGGSFREPPVNCRCAKRIRETLDKKGGHRGFRCAK